MTNRDHLEPVLNPPEDYSMIATAQPEASLPLISVEWRHITDARLTEPGKLL